MKLPALLASAALALAISGTAYANSGSPFGTLVFDAPSGVVGANDSIDVALTFTLDSNSMGIDLTRSYEGSLPTDWTSITGFGLTVGWTCTDTFTGGCNSAGHPYKYAFDFSPGGFQKVQNNSLVLNPGESISFNLVTLTPNGAPVPAGTYIANHSIIYGTLSGTAIQMVLDAAGNPVLDADGQNIYADSAINSIFTIAETCPNSVCNSPSYAGPTLFSRTVTAVPEPETYAMLLAGLGFIGVTARRRKAGKN